MNIFIFHECDGMFSYFSYNIFASSNFIECESSENRHLGRLGAVTDSCLGVTGFILPGFIFPSVIKKERRIFIKCTMSK